MVPRTLGDAARSRSSRWMYYAHRLLQRCSHGRAGLFGYIVVAQPLGRHRPVGIREDPRTRIREVSADDPLIDGFPRPAEINRARFEAGSRCHVVTVGGAFAGHIWVAERFYDEDEVRCRFALPRAPRSCWDFDVYVAPPYRASRVLARLWHAVDCRLRADGFAWTLSRISRLNTASLLAHERLGAVPLASATFLALGPLQLMAASCPPWVHVGVRMRSRPELTLPAPPRHGGMAPSIPSAAPGEPAP